MSQRVVAAEAFLKATPSKRCAEFGRFRVNLNDIAADLHQTDH
jgi:hypothetical protein